MYVLCRNIVAVLYPAYCSFKAMQHKSPKQIFRWMVYWIVLAAFTVFEILADVTLGYIMPFYSIFKLLFIVWLISSVTCGARVVFRHLLYPRLLQHETSIDNTIGKFDGHLLYMFKCLVLLWTDIRDAFESNCTTAAVIENGEDHIDGLECEDDEVFNHSHDAVSSHINETMDTNVSDKEWLNDENLNNISHYVSQTTDDDEDYVTEDDEDDVTEDDEEDVTHLSHDFFDDYENASGDYIYNKHLARLTTSTQQ